MTGVDTTELLRSAIKKAPMVARLVGVDVSAVTDADMRLIELGVRCGLLAMCEQNMALLADQERGRVEAEDAAAAADAELLPCAVSA